MVWYYLRLNPEGFFFDRAQTGPERLEIWSLSGTWTRKIEAGFRGLAARELRGVPPKFILYLIDLEFDSWGAGRIIDCLSRVMRARNEALLVCSGEDRRNLRLPLELWRLNAPLYSELEDALESLR